MLTGEMLADAPDYESLSEQAITVGQNTTVIEKEMETIPNDPGIYSLSRPLWNCSSRPGLSPSGRASCR